MKSSDKKVLLSSHAYSAQFKTSNGLYTLLPRLQPYSPLRWVAGRVPTGALKLTLTVPSR